MNTALVTPVEELLSTNPESFSGMTGVVGARKDLRIWRRVKHWWACDWLQDMQEARPDLNRRFYIDFVGDRCDVLFIGAPKDIHCRLGLRDGLRYIVQARRNGSNTVDDRGKAD